MKKDQVHVDFPKPTGAPKTLVEAADLAEFDDGRRRCSRWSTARAVTLKNKIAPTALDEPKLPTHMNDEFSPSEFIAPKSTARDEHPTGELAHANKTKGNRKNDKLKPQSATITIYLPAGMSDRADVRWRSRRSS